MRHYKHLSDSERKVIQNNIWDSKNITQIAEATGRHKSTISRELKRNKTQKKDGLYRACEAHEKYKKRINNKKTHIQHKIDEHNDLFLYLFEKLFKKWAPDAIAGRLKIEFPNDKRYHLSHESIYQWIYKTNKKYNTNLHRLLPYGKKKRYRRRNKRERRINIPGRKSIHIRPKEVESREKFGHWEADLIVGKKSRSYLLTIQDRKHKYLLCVKLSDKKKDSVVRAFQEAFSDIPNSMIKTITVDNGIEFICFKEIEELFECEVFFADPYASYQKGGIEHANMLIRRTYKKYTDFRNVTKKELKQTILKINNRPRKVLNYFTPYEKFSAETVALET